MINALESEHAVIGCALYDQRECDEAFERLKPEHFYDPVHQGVWSAILKRVRSGGMVDPVLIKQDMGDSTGFAELGGLRWLADMTEAASLWTLPSHIEAVVDNSARRAISALATEVKARASSSEGTADQILGELERGAAEIARDGGKAASAVPVGLHALDMLEGAWNGEFVGTPTGLNTIDHVTGGIRPEDVWFVGGRTSMGKSVVGLALARGLAEQGRGVMVFSLEMPLREVQARLIADLAYDVRIPRNGQQGGNIRYGDLLKGRGNDFQKERARANARKLASLPIAVCDRGGLTIDDIRTQAQRQMRAWEKAGVQRGAVLIDHIGLVKPHNKRNDSKAAETADTVNELKTLAKTLRAPVIALCQVNRATESRNDKRPTLSDLNWSGAIEQIADFICLLYRESYYLERSGSEEDRDQAYRVENEIELLIHKNRSGPICNLKAFIDIASNAVRDRDDQPQRAFG